MFTKKKYVVDCGFDREPNDQEVKKNWFIVMLISSIFKIKNKGIKYPIHDDDQKIIAYWHVVLITTTPKKLRKLEKRLSFIGVDCTISES